MSTDDHTNGKKPKQRSLFPSSRRRRLPKSVVAGKAETSKDAAELAATVAASQARRILAVLRAAPEGLTDKEIQRETGIDGNSERPRRSQLEKDGYIRRQYRAGKIVKRDRCMVLVATEFMAGPVASGADAGTEQDQ